MYLYTMKNLFDIEIDNSFCRNLPKDSVDENTSRQVYEAAFSKATPRIPSKPKSVIVSKEVANILGLKDDQIDSDDFLAIFSGAKILENAEPYAMCYGGHQFGNWAGQLGDGRAINLCEVVYKNLRWAIQLKGAGRTPYSRTADGLAVLRSSVREYLCSEAMHYLGVPTTRALSLIETGDKVLRDVMYDGNSAYEKGAIVSRVAPSFIRFGSFELFASRNDVTNLKALADYTIQYFYPESKDSKTKYTDFFNSVAKKTLDMVIHWQRVGFVHGVMNTDNMSILGLTIDYGPYGWQDNFDLDWTPNTTDFQHKRYRFGNQVQIALWNLVQLANAIYLLVEDPKPFEECLENWKKEYHTKYIAMMCSKIGITTPQNSDINLITDLEENLALVETDMTIFYRLLSKFNESEPSNGFALIQEAFYDATAVSSLMTSQWNQWFDDYAHRLQKENTLFETRKIQMNLVNPKYVLRNYMAQMAIESAEKGDYSLVYALDSLLKTPYDEQVENQKWFAKRPDWARDKIGCSTLSCSS